MQCKNCLSVVIIIMLVLVTLDALCGPEISPWAAYIVPIVLASRYCGFSTGAMYSVIAGGLLCVAARHSGHPYSSELYFLVAVSSQTITLVVISWLTARLSVLEQSLRALRA